MSRSVAGLAIFLVCVASGQRYPPIQLKGTGNEPSIAIDHISGGHYPAGSFSIGHGYNNQNGDGGPGADYGRNGQGYPNNGDKRPVYPDNGGNGLQDPSTGTGGQEQNEGAFVNGNNDIGGSGGQNYPNGGVSDEPAQNNYGQQPASSYDNNYNNPQTNNVPVRNSASRNRFYATILNYLFSWFGF